MRHRSLPALVLGTVLLLAPLTACTHADPADNSTAQPTAAPSLTTRPDGTGEAYQAGQVVTDAPTLMPENLRAFPMDDGTWLVVDPTQELPEPVTTVLEAKAAQLPLVDMDSADPSSILAAQQAAATLGTYVSDNVGAQVAVVRQVEGGRWSGWADSGAGSATLLTRDTQAEATAAVDEWLTAQGVDPTKVVHLGA